MKKIYEDIKKVFESRSSFRIIYGIGVVVVALLIFSAGVNVGYHKASFGKNWEENYTKNFGMGPRGDKQDMGFRGMGMMPQLPVAHGAVGKIIKTDLPKLIVEDIDGTEKSIILNENTKIQQGKTRLEQKDLTLDRFIVTIGEPNKEGVIEAKFIRIIPSPELLNK